MKSILIFTDEIYEDLELWYPKVRLLEEGHKVTIAGEVAGKEYKGKHGYPCKADLAFSQVDQKNFDALVVPGGYAPDKLRRYEKVLELVKAFHAQKKPIAFICHAGWVLISAKILNGRKATSFSGIKDDMENAGVLWEDAPVVVDENLVSSRSPSDLPQFLKALIKLLK